MKISTKKMAIGGIFAAMVTLGTMIIRIPTPIPANGYVHIGDSLVYLSGILLGPVLGGIVSGLGSGIADLFGYAVYAPATAVIKCLDAFVTALIFISVQKKFKGFNGLLLGYIAGTLVGGAIMVSGYYLYETLLYGTATAVVSIIPNIAQAIGGALIGLPLLIALDKTKYFERLNGNFPTSGNLHSIK